MKSKVFKFTIVLIFVIINISNSKAQSHRTVCYGEEVRYNFPACDDLNQKYISEKRIVNCEKLK